MRVMGLVAVVVSMGLLAGCVGAEVAPAAAPRAADQLVDRGHYLVRIMDCAGCHTPGALRGAPDASRELAGSDVGFAFPGGVVYPPNLTADPETGLGRWSDAQTAAAVRQGVGRDGRALVPIMPWPSYSALTPADTAALIAYLRTVPPVRLAAPRRVGPDQTPTAPYLMLVVPPR